MCYFYRSSREGVIPRSVKGSILHMFFAIALLSGISMGSASSFGMDAPEWTSPDRTFRILLKVEPRGRERSNSPVAPLRINFQKEIKKQGASGSFDEHTIEVIAYDASNKPVVFDASRPGYERYLLPWRIDQYYGITDVDLIFVVPHHQYTDYAVYFDTIESGVGQPERYPGLVGDGDFFREDFKRREVNACHFDTFCDLDGDGDLDLFKAGVEPIIYCYENVGANRFIERGRLTSGGELFVLPHNSGNGRSWMTLAFYDWDEDGDQDLIPSFLDGPDMGHFVLYENTTREHDGLLTFTRRGKLYTKPDPPEVPEPLGGARGGWFPTIEFVKDWDGDGDGLVDLVISRNNHVYLHRNLGPDGAGGYRYANSVPIKAAGNDITLLTLRAYCADLDGDGLRDLLAGTQGGPIYFFRNIGSKTEPRFIDGRILAFNETYFIEDAHSGVQVADFTGDGLVDLVVGRFWERMPLYEPAGRRDYGGMYENVGTATAPKFERRDASNGAPHTEQLQKCDVIRQNCVRAADWDKDGRTDLIAGDTDGFLWYFRNQTNNLAPVFAAGKKLKLANGDLLSVTHSGGHARHDICDWNNDGKRDLVIADGFGCVWWYENVGSDAAPSFAPGQHLEADGRPIDRGDRSSVLVCDWNNDGKKDVIFADLEDGYVFFENIGTDAQPVLGAPKSLGLAMYTRPNLGSFVDWDGDGKKDLIACNFENNIRLYRNVGSGKKGRTPRFDWRQGTFLVKPFSVMMTSGADVVDFNSDGDLDILTGQGHAGSGLRFYEHDYIHDWMNDSFPTVTIRTAQKKFK